MYWLSTVRPDGRPHVTTLLSVWVDGALYFCTGAEERKAKNLAENPQCILTTGSNSFEDGLDVVVEGEAVNVRDEARLQRVADAYETKYGADWHFDVRDGVFHHGAGAALRVRGRAHDGVRVPQGRAVQPDPLELLRGVNHTRGFCS